MIALLLGVVIAACVIEVCPINTFPKRSTSVLTVLTAHYTWARKMKFRKSRYGQKFGGMMQLTMKRITVRNGHTLLMFAFSNLGCLKMLSFSDYLV